ncbi:MAG: hypothetical protein GF388_12245 [Candidatus Aegiribacteria sp.]|nr:hypothetical protein [Candidatus Aegiribacteria sp.]
MIDFQQLAELILGWVIERNFIGYDPYDGLRSKLLEPLTKYSRLFRLLVIQAVKQCPFNPRKLLLINPGLNPKGLALFLSGLGHYPDLDKEGYTEKLQQMILSLTSKPDGSPAFSDNREPRSNISLEEVEIAEPFAWGYNFPWQGRAFYQPAWYPTVVCSSFVLDAFRDTKSDYYPIIAKKLAEFTINTLNIHEDDTGICFSYSPRDNSRVYNASLFAAKILAQASCFDKTNEAQYRQLTEKASDYVVSRQNEDGSWVYGEADHWQWIDNLHTGFVLETLSFISNEMETDKYSHSISKGLSYYKSNLFEDDWTANYYSTKKYPLDPHSYAQAAVTFIELEQYTSDAKQIAAEILSKAMQDLWDSERKGFIFRQYKTHKDRMIYLRWNQGWMFKAICRYLGDAE